MTQYQTLCRSSLDTADLGFLTDNAIYPVLGTDIAGNTRYLLREDRIYAEWEGKSFPIAHNFSDFLGLLLACGHTSLIRHALDWPKIRFQRELNRLYSGHKQKMICNALVNCFHPPVITDPYGYIHSLQINQETPKNRQTSSVNQGIRQWHGQNLQILDQTATVDLCVRIPGTQILSHYDRWEGIGADAVQLQQKAATDPFSLQTQLQASIGGTPVGSEILNLLFWDPLADNTADAEAFLRGHQLDPEDGWIMLEVSLDTGKRKKNIRSLSMALISEKVMIPGPSIVDPQANSSFSLTHPVKETPLLLSIDSLDAEALDPNFLTNPPCHYMRLCYHTDPPMGTDTFQIFDPTPNDRLQPPVGCTDPIDDPELENAPTASMVETADSQPSHIRTAFSARHYHPQKAVKWHTVFCCKRYPDAVLPIVR